jgi:hypothetical protein
LIIDTAVNICHFKKSKVQQAILFVFKLCILLITIVKIKNIRDREKPLNLDQVEAQGPAIQNQPPEDLLYICNQLIILFTILLIVINASF